MYVCNKCNFTWYKIFGLLKNSSFTNNYYGLKNVFTNISVLDNNIRVYKWKTTHKSIIDEKNQTSIIKLKRHVIIQIAVIKIIIVLLVFR